MQKARLRIECSLEAMFSKILHEFNKRFDDSLTKKSKDSEWEEEFGQPIREGRIDLAFDFYPNNKGGWIVINFRGTKEEIDRWVKVGLKDRIAMKAFSKLIKFKVER